MAFCTECGKSIADGAKFCANCGATVTTRNFESTNQRKTVYEGEIHKCPNCGELLKSFEVNCPTCGYELRGSRATNSVRELSLKLEAVENRRERNPTRSRRSMFDYNAVLNPDISKTDEQKSTIISTFPIPNTKEDLIEFMVLAGSNIDFKSYENDIRTAPRVVSDAWKAKFEQAYQKAEVLFENDPDFQYIQTSHQKMGTSIKKAKTRQWKLLGIVFVGLAILLTVIIVGSNIADSKDDAKELTRLESIVVEVEDCLERSEYKLALMNAESIKTDSYDDEIQRQYEIKREYLIDKVIEEATQNGVILERTSPQNSVESSPDANSKGFIGGFIEGFTDAISPETEGE